MARCKWSAGGLPEVGRNILEASMVMANLVSCILLACLLSFPLREEFFGIGVFIVAAVFTKNLPSCDASSPNCDLLMSQSMDGHDVTTSEDDGILTEPDNESMTEKGDESITEKDEEMLSKKDEEMLSKKDVETLSKKDEEILSKKDGDVSETEERITSHLDRLPFEIQGRIFEHIPYEHIFQLKLVSNKLKRLTESKQFQELLVREKPALTACYFFIDRNGDWQWAGHDLFSQKWRRMPTLKFLPANCKPDPDLFKEFLICAEGGLVCINSSKTADKERLIVFNPLSREYRELPPLNYRRNPVLMHMVVDPASQAYKVIVAGSSKAGDEDDLSRITEVYDSRTGEWERMGDLPGPAFALNEYQTGVFQEGKLFCIGFVEGNDDQISKGILGFDVEEGKWSAQWTHAFSFCTLSSAILQLVECNGKVYLFSERENNGSIEHWVDRLEWILVDGDEKNTCMMFNIIKKKKAGGRSLEVFPESVCVPYSDGRLCILSALDHTGVVYDIRDQETLSEFPLEALPEKGFRGQLGFFGLNSMSFIVEPRFNINV